MILVSVDNFVGQYMLAQSNADNIIIQSYIDREEKKTLYKLLGKELADLLITYIASTKPTATSGLLVVDQYYEITDYEAGDDFTNVGAVTNATGERFIATGTTPTTWTNSSELTTLVKRYEDILLPFYIEIDVFMNWIDNYCPPKFAESHGIMDLLLIQIYYSYLSEEQIINSQSGVMGQVTENGAVQSNQNAFRKGEQKWNNGGLDTWYAIYWFCKWKYPDIYPEFKGIIEQPRYSAIL